MMNNLTSSHLSHECSHLISKRITVDQKQYFKRTVLKKFFKVPEGNMVMLNFIDFFHLHFMEFLSTFMINHA